MTEAGSDPTTTAAGPGASGRLALLAAARVAAQALGFLWFIYAARVLPTRELGMLSSGLALVVVLGGLCDLGAARTLVRHVAARPITLRSNLRRALVLRVLAGTTVGAAACILLGAVTEMESAVFGLAAWIAVASGATEVGFAALRSIGRARSEMRILMLERVLFTVVAVLSLAAGSGPLVILTLYALTNSLSAVLAAGAAFRGCSGAEPGGPFFDSEGRHTAVSSTLVIVAPRASLVVLLLLGTTPAVGIFAVAQKPIEALSLLIVALAAPALPILRARVIAGSTVGVARVTGRIAAAGLATAAGLLGWLVADPRGGLRLLLGAGSDLAGAPALQALTVAACLAILRGALELLLLAQENAAALVRATTAQLTVSILVGVVLVDGYGASGAAWAAALGELVALMFVFRAAIVNARAPDLLGPMAGSLGLLLLTAAAVAIADTSAVGGGVLAGVATLLGLAVARRHVIAIDAPDG